MLCDTLSQGEFYRDERKRADGEEVDSNENHRLNTRGMQT